MDQYQVHNRDEACCGANREGDRKFPGDEVDRTITQTTKEASLALVGSLQGNGSFGEKEIDRTL